MLIEETWFWKCGGGNRRNKKSQIFLRGCSSSTQWLAKVSDRPCKLAGVAGGSEWASGCQGVIF